MNLIDELKQIMKEENLSPDAMSKFIGCSARQVDRWVSGEAKPTVVYQGLIRKGINKLKRLSKQMQHY